MVAPAGALISRLNVSVLGGLSGSKAEFVIVNNDPGRTVCGSTGAMPGGLFTSLTMTVKLLMSLKGGEPFSVTCTPITSVLGPWVSVGVQVNTPVTGSSLAPVGAEVRLKVKRLVERSELLALLVTTSGVDSSIVWSEGTVRTGGVGT